MANRGRQGKVLDDPILEAKRLKMNEAARRYKARQKQLAKELDASVRSSDEDEHGIRPVDERRYIKCFHSGWIGQTTELAYVRRMTGLSLYQIYILQERTGEIPTPAVSLASAKSDKKYREEYGEMY